ncbi:MAG: endolytic transglycosylase MltG [Gemmatimonadota bacterium]|nr:endolytic transglycosylase MltG [Gemmatimonadota bacterium]
MRLVSSGSSARAAMAALLAGALVLGVGVGGCRGGGLGPGVRVTIPNHASFKDAADSLAAAGVIDWPLPFRLYAKALGKDRDIKAGTYALRRGASWSELVVALSRGQGLEARVTIPEGWSLAEIESALAKALGANEDSIAAAARDTALLRRLDIPSGSLEGYLFPDTYRFPYGTSPREAIHEMVRRFEGVWRPEWTERLPQLAMSRHDVITLASIIEKEARLAEERPVISAVYHNRLRLQMPLQADPTIQYARGEHTDRVLYRDLAIESRYNTYKHPGLPPGPIASPGRASIEAALYPAGVRYLYFVAGADGHHEFRETFREHVQAKGEMKRELRERRGRAANHSGASGGGGGGGGRGASVRR